MDRITFSRKVKDRTNFLVLAELTGGPGFSFAPIEKFLRAYRDTRDKAQNLIPPGFDFAAVTLPQSPGGVANIEPASVISYLQSAHLADDLDIIPHVTCKDANADAITSSLAALKRLGVSTILALTGDKPTKAQGVFELESVGLLQLIRSLNWQAYIDAKPDALDAVHQFFPGAAVSPFKYTAGSLLQQYYKMEKKTSRGARFLITQVGWDWKKSLELFQYLRETKLDVPIIGNVYLLSTITPAPRLMHDIELPGCFVSDELLAKVMSESLDDHIERAAQQTAMYKALGARGVDIGGVHDFNVFIKILQRAAEIGNNWEQFKHNLSWPAKQAFYLYDDTGRRVPIPQQRKKFNQRFFNFSHRAFLDPQHTGFRILKKTMAALGTEKQTGAIYKSFNASEKALKYLLFECQECGDCYLPENFGLCTIGGCEKGLDNAPCGDSTVDGKCGNNLDRACIGDRIFDAAAAEKGGLELLQKTVNKPRIHALAHTSSILNYLFARDHTARSPIITIGESIHASIPKTGKIMKLLADRGPQAYTAESAPLNYIRVLIESQVADGADYIEVNLDAFGEDDPQIAIQMMREYAKLVRKWGDGVPICVDSSNDAVLTAGLDEWYNTSEPVNKPLLNSIKVYTMDRMLPLKKEFDFAFIGLLVSEDKPTGPGGSHSVDELYCLAKRIFETAVGGYGFGQQDVFFDTTVFPLAIDMPMEPNVPGYTYRAFETIRKIKSDPTMKGVHCSLGVSNCVRDLPGRRIGICRAYLAKAMEYGLDAAIVNVAHHYGQVPAAPELLDLIDAFAKMDGSMDYQARAMDLMGKFCRENRKPT
jgi:methylenetetrahydrofolate reductase (NADPH)